MQHGTYSNFTLDARFEVLESPFPLLQISLSASQNLYTRRGTLIGIGGKPENVGLIHDTSIEDQKPYLRLLG